MILAMTSSELATQNLSCMTLSFRPIMIDQTISQIRQPHEDKADGARSLIGKSSLFQSALRKRIGSPCVLFTPPRDRAQPSRATPLLAAQHTYCLPLPDTCTYRARMRPLHNFHYTKRSPPAVTLKYHKQAIELRNRKTMHPHPRTISTPSTM